MTRRTKHQAAARETEKELMMTRCSLAIIYTGMNDTPQRVYLDPNVMLADIRKSYPDTKVKLVPDNKTGRHKIEVTGHTQDGPMGQWVGSYTLGFRVLSVQDPQNWGKVE